MLSIMKDEVTHDDIEGTTKNFVTFGVWDEGKVWKLGPKPEVGIIFLI
jgi:hypothetical protein